MPCPPEGFSKPEAHLAFVVPVGQVGMAIQFQFDCADGFGIFLQTDGISLFGVEHVPDHVTTLVQTLMRRPSGDRAHIGIAGVSV